MAKAMATSLVNKGAIKAAKLGKQNKKGNMFKLKSGSSKKMGNAH